MIAGLVIAHPLLVVSNLLLAILIQIDILPRHDATMLFGDECTLQMHTGVCEVCLKQRDEPNPDQQYASAAVCAIDLIMIDHEARDRVRSSKSASQALIRRSLADHTPIANFFRPTENHESEMVSRFATLKTPTSAATVVACLNSQPAL